MIILIVTLLYIIGMMATYWKIASCIGHGMSSQVWWIVALWPVNLTCIYIAYRYDLKHPAPIEDDITNG